MGFMDKAKKLAEQAQEKLDDAQKNFNQSGSPQAEQPAQAARYDEHGRPIQEEAPAPAADPADAPPAEEAASAPAEEAASPPPASEPPAGGANASPDPFKPIQ